ncbi:class I SAM-dependent methyltransferase [Streptomyces iconiensis]|uniref:Class I SAM-dependent methyltransferase n=1 Tax=Streptomyces iconiensis TaxID=1384038 RepID=A0ABT7A382_9ACTN|nr:class I SAM-dependent methyltransferase [Streptomyces iconiensis]MDJ1135534.1 class I SAM-dependent methyltransferase [Streptomyces iconiensis]
MDAEQQAGRVDVVRWSEDGEERSALWRSESGARPPKRVVAADDRMTADAAYKLACEGTALLWRGDYHGARQLLAALGRRVDRKPPKMGATPSESFHLHRQALSRRARVLGMLLVPLETSPDGSRTVPLRRAPEVAEACAGAYGEPGAYAEHGEPGRYAEQGTSVTLVSLRELQGVLGAHEWRRKGVPVEALGGEHVHPYHGVFSPVRGEYIDLVAHTPLPQGRGGPLVAFDIGTGTGVLAVVLARREGGRVGRVVATDLGERALACARENVRRLGAEATVDVVRADLFPAPEAGRADLVVCNPPWLPAKPTSVLEQAVYDPGSRMLRGFLDGLAARLAPGGEGWLILSDLAEHLGLRARDELLGWIGDAGLEVAGRHDARPRHGRATDPAAPLHAARAAETTSLWRLASKS